MVTAPANPLDMRTSLAHPGDVTYQLYRQKKVRELLKFTEIELRSMLRLQQQQPAPRDDSDGAITREIMGTMLTSEQTPMAIKNILGAGSGSGLNDGSPLIRQDLDPLVTALFIKTFLLYEQLSKVPSNGLVYAFNQMTTPDPNMSTTSNTISTVVTELGTVGFTASTYVRQTSPIAVFGIGRGVDFKELAAVRAGGMAWDPSKMELAGGMTKLAYDVQTMLFQGNGTYASGTAANEGGAYNTAYFDGLRLVLGSVAGSNYASNNAVQGEQGTLNLTQQIKSSVAKAAQAGGIPDIVIMSINAKEQLDQENEGNRRYNDNMVEIIPGVQVNQIPWANGILKVLPVPGFSQGAYVSPLSGQLVEDVLFIQTDEVEMPWLWNEGITVIELPAALDYTLSQRYIAFCMYGLAVKAPPFMGKVRRLAQ